MRQVSITNARRLAITKQKLTTHEDSLHNVIRALGCVQLDPIKAVERTQWLVLWSRLGNFDRSKFNQLMWQENALFEYWAHEASIVLTEDYPLHKWHMEKWRTPEGNSSWAISWRKIIEEHKDLRDHMLNRLRDEGPLPSRGFKDEIGSDTKLSGWNSPGVINRMFDHMWRAGDVMVAGRKGNQRFWDIAERVLPDWTPRETLTPEQVTDRATQTAIKALGIATPMQIKKHYTRKRYPTLPKTLTRLEKEGKIQRVDVVKSSNITDDASLWKQPLYIHTDDIPLLESIEAGDWQPRTTLLSPFDNLICDRDRTHDLWDFYFRIEIYVPQAKREYGYYVLPILHGDRLIGRIDPKMDRKTSTLHIQNVYQEPDAPDDAETVEAIHTSIHSLAKFLGAEHINFQNDLPVGWEMLQM